MARPPSGRINVVRMRTAVVLPAPLGPSTPSTVPRGTDRSIPRSAWTSPNDFVRFSTRIAGPEPICDTTPSSADRYPVNFRAMKLTPAQPPAANEKTTHNQHARQVGRNGGRGLIAVGPEKGRQRG